ncbi:MAG TPA: hypothetical protein VM802_21630 [Chitinophaga sp.]|uniref:WD40/YVTN/BNR-like repeat-containing protein n=1 Tax=Chitinophaga sp. TaxID=1869181 RepID=UPI002BEFA7F0|nr:oxidoreductase [Chitinophaga sp.]HVI47488.1 hypothetical protein [Chitinophaga sp.]
MMMKLSLICQPLSNAACWLFHKCAGFRLTAIMLVCTILQTTWYFLPAAAQSLSDKPHIKILVSAPPAKSIRGLCPVSDDIVWASGTGGMVGKSTDGGQNWQWTQIRGCDSCDWRSLYAFNDKKALVLNAGEPARLFLTEDGGLNWQQVFSDTTHGIFFDAIDFFNDREGIAIGDPLQNRFTIIRTHDGGKTWRHDPVATLPVATNGESLFAASGTSLVTLPGNKVYFGTGGTVSRLFTSGSSWLPLTIPIIQGSSTTGAFSIAFLNNKIGIAIGGDYKNDTLTKGNCVITIDGGHNWYTPHTPPHGFKSCVAFITPKVLVATGTSGTDISFNKGRDWQQAGQGFHVVKRARNGKRIFLAGTSIGILGL